MPLLPQTALAQAEGLHIVASLFVTFAFKTSPLRVWEGDGPIDREGLTWQGVGMPTGRSGNPLYSIEGLELSMDGSAPQLNLSLSGVDSTVVAAAREDVANEEIEGRDLTIRIGFYDATQYPEMIPLDDLIVLGVWTMQKPSFSATGVTLRNITLPCETLFVQRSRAPFGLLTDRDQQRRFPGDLACQFPPTLVDRDVAWPRR